MLKSTYRYFLPILILIILIAGCAPVISRPTLKGIDRTITFRDIKKDPAAYQNENVLLGGKIIKVINKKNESLALVLQSPLRRNLKPLPENKSEGRFIIRFSDFIDPLVYRGKLITVTGVVGAPITRPLNSTTYTYPVIEAGEFYLWKMGQNNSPPVSFGIGFGFSSGY